MYRQRIRYMPQQYGSGWFDPVGDFFTSTFSQKNAKDFAKGFDRVWNPVTKVGAKYGGLIPYVGAEVQAGSQAYRDIAHGGNGKRRKRKQTGKGKKKKGGRKKK